MNFDKIQEWRRCPEPKNGKDLNNFWSVPKIHDRDDRYGNRPDGRRVVMVTNLGTVKDLFSGRIQIVLTDDGYFHIHGVANDYDKRPIVSRHFGDNPDQDEVIKWAQVVSRLHT